MLRVILCDDERLALQRLRQLLSPHPNFKIVGEASNKAAALILGQGKTVTIGIPHGETTADCVQSQA